MKLKEKNVYIINYKYLHVKTLLETKQIEPKNNGIIHNM